MEKNRHLGGALELIVVTLFMAAGAVQAQPDWSVGKLPGCDNLSERMAGYYVPVKLEVKPAAPQYALPLDPAKLTNADFMKMMYSLRDPALAGQFDKLLRQNGFAAVAGGRQQDVAAFYKNLKDRGLPIFVTSDSLLHLYHIQFDETLKDIEEREFFSDAVAISKAIQAEALRLHGQTGGDLQKAARLLVGYATVPVVLLSRTDLSAEAAEALKEVKGWPARPDWRRQTAFREKYSELLEVLEKEARPAEGAEPGGLPIRPAPMRPMPMGPMPQAQQLREQLEKYLQAHPPASPDAGTLIPALVAREVRAELDLIAAHAGFAESPLFTYKEDYSQYVPRGHYTRSKRLKQYFKALMWYGRMTFLIRGKTPEVDGIIPQAEARIQTLAACALAGMMETRLPDARSLAQAWDRLYAVTAYYVGLADDLTPYEYRSAMRGAIGERVSGASLADAGKFFELRKRLAELRKPEIYSGLGDLAGPPVAIADERTLAEALAKTQGLRLMGQRYIPDSFMLGRLVYPTVGLFSGAGTPFTLVQTQGGPARGFPRGLDVMAVLGSAGARNWLKRLGDDQYARYDERLTALTKQFEAVSEAGWNRNMYWSWLYTLAALLKDCPSGCPTFMQTEAWRDKQLSAALASWSQLRHDTILYAKQSYTMFATGMPQPPKMVEGYVEPVPEFYARLLALTRMTLKGLSDFKVLDEKAARRLQSLERIVARLLDLSKQELAGGRLAAEDYEFIRSFGDRLSDVVAGVSKEGTETTIVADVHTDGNSRQVLEEATGYLHEMAVVYPMPDGGLVAGVGPVLSHYEFKHPMSDRLTDEAWKKMLQSPGVPSLPEWARSFTVGEVKPPARPALRPTR